VNSVSPEPRWPASLALVACVALYVLLPDRLVVVPLALAGPRRAAAGALIGTETSTSRRERVDSPRHPRPRCVGHPRQRRFDGAARTPPLGKPSFSRSTVDLLGRRGVVDERHRVRPLVLEVDRGGPHRRASGEKLLVDLQFPQMENPSLAPEHWRPSFTDYLYTSFANGTSFAPADAMPLTFRMKALFTTESIVSLVTIAVVAARAVNILR